ncbi:Retrovirus-related Pol polyprotein from transposon TNT 1-94 [Sesamum angolense]|uniref:Retrovirus-related Pol polyprotein from transposon TNT 1-94 n=1 Tax=Sesamum angolense TaxID=2727404 RepID=A0AAE1VZ88_9LAMI|nr:Retrovirus-related Pol polyprotein from transposon TNT 1-94 [Sesamum angolense]
MVMDDEMSALISRGTWELVEVPPNADIVACRWVFTLEFRADGTLEWYKARLVAKGFTQTYGVDYFENFSPVARLNSIRVLFSLAINLNWPMYQMDIKNAFLYGDLNETVYMEQPPGYVA